MESVRKGRGWEQRDSAVCSVCWLLDGGGPASVPLLHVGTSRGVCICCVAFRCVRDSIKVGGGVGGESWRCEYSHTRRVDTERRGQVVSPYSRRLTLDSRSALF